MRTGKERLIVTVSSANDYMLVGHVWFTWLFVIRNFVRYRRQIFNEIFVRYPKFCSLSEANFSRNFCSLTEKFAIRGVR